PENEPSAVLRVREVWEACGAVVQEVPPHDHDRIFAAVSHLPHLLAFGLVHDLAERANAEQLFGFAASGFRDFTRIAGSSPEMWRDICIANRQPLLAELDQYLAELAYLRALLLSADGEQLEKLFAEARDARLAWGERFRSDPGSMQ
ncbi:MAG: prephenate dehydrogenase/arogenate dehydrogenase family protein, partial [Azoarcus sp.]|nr:prephenate dehydrogenase/arogenate dehydrogenase family protein [Azoarcus sp.]